MSVYPEKFAIQS